MPDMLLSSPALIIRKFTYKKCVPPSKNSCRRYWFGILNAVVGHTIQHLMDKLSYNS